MSTQTFYTWVLPCLIGAFGILYAIWAGWQYDRAMDREERLTVKPARSPAE